MADETDGARDFWGAVYDAAQAVAPELAGVVLPSREALAELDEPLVLVLDDFHLIRSPAVMRDIGWLLERGGERLHLLIATRSDPPLRLERLRLNGVMSELRAADLAFTLPEAEALLEGLELSESDLESLWRRTVGWVAGLRLAQLSLEDSPDRHAFITSFAGDDRAVSDYLISEVVERQPPDKLDFLLRTCVTDRLTGELADAVTGGHGGERTLGELAGRDGLVTSIDGHGRWYRYHPLLLEVLRAESRRRLPADQAQLHSRAAGWHACRGSALEAVRHAVTASDWEQAGRVIVEHWLELLTRGGAPALLQLAERLPIEVVRADAELALAVAGLRIEASDDRGADALLIDALRMACRLPEARARRYEVTSTAVALHRARLRGDVDGAVRAARRTLAGDWGRDLAGEVRALTLLNLGVAELWQGSTESAGLHLQQAVGVALDCSNDFLLFRAEAYASAVDAVVGRLDDARARGELAIEFAERHGWTDQAHAAMAYVALGSVELWQGRLREAEGLAERARTALAGSGEPLVRPSVALLGATLAALRGEPLAALDRARAAAARPPVPRLVAVSARLLEAELLLALGDPDRARSALEGLDASDTAVVLARVQLAVGDPGGARATAEAFLAGERDALVPFARVEAHVLEAIARDALRDEEGALVSLERALDMTEPRGCSLVLLRYGPPLRSLLGRLLARGTSHRSLAEELRATLDRGRAPEATAAPLLEPLSERELTVLRYLPTMMSNSDIAAEMFVSVNTVKTHLKHVYRKLDVTDRRDCVRRGRDLRLLSSGLRAS